MSKERERLILEILLKQKKVTVNELTSKLYISESSARRDLASLEKQNLIKRIHGGAIIDETPLSKNKLSFLIRELEQSSSKLNIAKKAIDLINNNDVIFLDASTSAYAIIPFLSYKDNITVVTNGVKALEKLAEYRINTISTGGNLSSSDLSLIGEEAYKTIETINADVAFFSCRGLSEDGYLTDISPEENYIRIRMIKNSARSYLLCTSDKKGEKYFHTLCHDKDITGIITDDPM